MSQIQKGARVRFGGILTGTVDHVEPASEHCSQTLVYVRTDGGGLRCFDLGEVEAIVPGEHQGAAREAE